MRIRTAFLLGTLAFIACAPSTTRVDTERGSSPPSPALAAADVAVQYQLGPWLDGVHQAQLVAFYDAVSVVPPPVPVRRPTASGGGSPISGASPASSQACGGWADTVAAYFNDPVNACRVLMCESGGDPSAQNRSGASGLFQLMPAHAWRFEEHGWTWADRFDGTKNIVVAAELRIASGGWGPWSCRP